SSMPPTGPCVIEVGATHVSIGRDQGTRTSALNKPLRDGLMKIERTRHRHMCLDVLETGLLQRAVRSYVERIRFAKQALEPELLEININALPYTFRTETQASVIHIDHMQMHACSIAEHDSICRGEADEVFPLQPCDEDIRALMERQGEFLQHPLLPCLTLGQASGIDTQGLQMFGRRVMKVVDEHMDLVALHQSSVEAQFSRHAKLSLRRRRR